MVKGHQGQAEFEIWVKNFGRTPARLVGWKAPKEVHIVDSKKSLPVPPVYEGNYAMENYLIPDGEILIAIFNPSQSGHTAKRIEVATAQNVKLEDVESAISDRSNILTESPTNAKLAATVFGLSEVHSETLEDRLSRAVPMNTTTAPKSS